ncbi:MAG: metallophosphoesterase family protein [Smithellaceae bacterium]
MSRIFAIGDIHGCIDKLKELIAKIGAHPVADTLVFLGDYIDRAGGGPDAIDYVLALKNKYQNVVCLCGNHEYMLLRFLEGVDEDIYLANGGRATLKAYGISPADAIRKRKSKIPSAHLNFFESLQLYYETENYIFVHAGLRPGVPLAAQSAHDLVWLRQEFIDCDDDFGKRIVFGHTRADAPIITPNKIGIDTGAVYGGKLTCLELPAERFYQV